MSENQSVGSIRISDEVICIIVGIAVSETPGVCCPQTAGITDFIGKRKLPKGIRVDVAEENVTVEVAISVEYGKRVREVAEQVQEAVKKAVADMTGLNVLAVDVQVQSVVMPKTEEIDLAETEA